MENKNANKAKNKKSPEKQNEKRRRGMDSVYLCSVAGVFALTALSLLVLPKTTFSSAENRELTKYPELSADSYFSGEYAENISKWFADTVPARAELMSISAAVQNVKGVKLTGSGGSKIELVGDMKRVDEDDNDTADAPAPVTSKRYVSEPIHLDMSEEAAARPSHTEAPAAGVFAEAHENETSAPSGISESTQVSEETAGAPPETAPPAPAVSNEEIRDPGVRTSAGDADVEMYSSNGTAIVGDRAFLMYSRYPAMEDRYAAVINKFKAGLPDVSVYCMIVPTQCEFYSPPELDGYHSSQLKTINYIANQFVGVKNVDVYTPLAEHADENIYLRTDHHWTSLGAYYAAEAFAKTAGVPFADLSNYEKRVNKGFRGTMYGYTNYSPVIKDNPEDFFYYIPQHVSYTATYYNYKIEKVWNIVGAQEPFEYSFFVDFGDNGSDNYCTFMCGDAKIVRVTTNAGTGRRLAVFKDSFGSAIPGFLFGSFDEIYVLDMRYFTHNGIDFMKEKNVTDLLFCNNAFTTDNAGLVSDYETIVDQEDWGF